jgi:hypothetical protein
MDETDEIVKFCFKTEVDPGSWERGRTRALHIKNSVNFIDVFQISRSISKIFCK